MNLRDVMSVYLPDAPRESWESIKPNPANVSGGSGQVNVYWLVNPGSRPDRMAVLMCEGDPFTERTITIAEAAGYVLEGEGALILEGGVEVPFKPGSMLAIPKGVPLSWRWDTPFKVFFVYESNWTPLRDSNVFDSKTTAE